MVEQSPAISVKDILASIRARLGGAVALAWAAETCAEAGEVEQALLIILDVEQPLYEATTLLNAASLLHRPAEANKSSSRARRITRFTSNPANISTRNVPCLTTGSRPLALKMTVADG